MRKKFEQQTTLGIAPITQVKFPLRSRDELPPVLKALQHIFVTPELNEKIFDLLEEKICSGKKKTGRKGMDLWHILVLAVIRHTLDTNWDRLEHVANYDLLVRQILGVHVEKFGIEEMEFAYQTIVDNVSMIDEDLLVQINQVVVAYGQNLLKKKDDEPLRLKTDSYVLQTNVHFPTDLNLLWDSVRKCLGMVEKLKEETSVPGWRKIKSIRKNVKNLFRTTSHQVFRGKNEQRKKQAVKNYLETVTQLHGRFTAIINNPPLAIGVSVTRIIALTVALEHYDEYMLKMMDLVERRLLKEQKIPADEKIYSIFEEHTEWINKGKLYPNVELGHLLLITTDQYHFIVDYKVMEGEKDAAQIEPLANRIKQSYPAAKIYSQSFDKSFYSKSNYETLQQCGTEHIVLPKKGRLTQEEKERESDKTFKQLRNAHSAVESNINMLEHHGLNRCADKGIKGYKRYVGLSVLAYNLHILGNHIIAEEKQKAEAKEKRRQRNYKHAA